MKIITIKSTQEVRTESFKQTIAKLIREEAGFFDRVDKAIDWNQVTIYEKPYRASDILKALDPEAYYKTTNDIVRDWVEYFQFYFLDGDGTETEYYDVFKVVLES